MLGNLVQGLPDGSAHLPEWYDRQWKPHTDAKGFTDLGHQFEWVHLLIDANRLGVSPTLGAVADRVLQIFGGAGYMSDLPVERIYRDARAFRIGEGTSEMQRLQIARHLLAH